MSDNELILCYQKETNLEKKYIYRDALLDKFEHLVDIFKFKQRKYHDMFSPGDIRTFALFGLLRAFDLFKADKGAKFETFAYIKIRGAILDHIKSEGHEKRSLINKKKQIEKFITDYTEEYGESPKDLHVRELFGNFAGVNYKIPNSVSIDATDAHDDTLATEFNLINSNAKECVKEIFRLLPNKRYRLVFWHIYVNGTKIRQVAKVVNLTQSRVSQMNKHIVKIIEDSNIKDKIFWND